MVGLDAMPRNRNSLWASSFDDPWTALLSSHWRWFGQGVFVLRFSVRASLGWLSKDHSYDL